MAEAKTKAQAAKPESPWKTKKPITLPRVPGVKDQPDVTASVNGRIFRIKRGVEVEVPLPIYEVLKRSKKDKMEAEDFSFSRAMD